MRAACGITLSSEYIISVPRVPRYKLDPIVQANIARLQNAQRPTVKAANRKLDQIIKGLADISAGEGPPSRDPYESNPFKKAVQTRPLSATSNPFERPPIPNSTITYEQYKRGLRSNNTSEELATSEIVPLIPERAAIESAEVGAVPSVDVPLEDLNISAGQSIEALLDLSSGPFNSFSSGYASFDSLAAGLCAAPLPDQLLNSDLSGESLELNLGLDTEDELLGSDTGDLSLYAQPLMVRICRSRIDLDQIVANPAVRDEVSRISDISLESLSDGELTIGTEEAVGSATETEDTGRVTPKRPAQLLCVR